MWKLPCGVWGSHEGHPSPLRLACTCGRVCVQEVQQFWAGVLAGVDKPTAAKLLPNLDLTHPLGLRGYASAQEAAAGVAGPGLHPANGTEQAGSSGQSLSSDSTAPKKGRPPLYSYFISVKKQHPTKVALVRVSGAALEESGHDIHESEKAIKYKLMHLQSAHAANFDFECETCRLESFTRRWESMLCCSCSMPASIPW
jgi:hypothetical protein